MTHKLSRPEVDDFVENFDKANQAQVLSNVQEQREMLIQLLGEQQYEQFKDLCTNAVRASLSDSEPPPGVEDNVTWAAMLLHNAKSMLRRAVSQYYKADSEQR